LDSALKDQISFQRRVTKKPNYVIISFSVVWAYIFYSNFFDDIELPKDHKVFFEDIYKSN